MRTGVGSDGGCYTDSNTTSSVARDGFTSATTACAVSSAAALLQSNATFACFAPTRKPGSTRGVFEASSCATTPTTANATTGPTTYDA